MVFRSLVSSVVFSLPLSDKLVPGAIARKLKGNVEANEEPTRAPLPHHYPEEISNQKQKIYQKVLAKRQHQRGGANAVLSPKMESEATLSAAAGTLHDPLFTGSHYLQFNEVDHEDDYYPSNATFTVESLRNGNSHSLHKRDPSSSNIDSDNGTLIPSSASSLNVEYRRKVSFGDKTGNASPLGIYSSASREEISNERVNRYLEEQNDKFDALINRNIELVLDDDEARTPVTLQDSIYDLLDVRDRNISHKLQDISTILGFAGAGVIHRVLPWKKKKEVSSSDDSLEFASFASASSSSSSPLLSLDSPSAFSYPSRTEGSEYPPSVKAIVDNLDTYRKVQLYHYLQEDLDVEGGSKDEIPSDSPSEFHLLQLNESGITLDKIQALAILLVRLTFAGIKLIIPISIRFYHKFTQNDLYMLNKKNFNAFLGFLIRLLKVVEEKVNGETISVYQYGHQSSSNSSSGSQHNIPPQVDPLDEFYDEMTNNASDYLNYQLGGTAEGITLKNDTATWQGMALNYILNQYLSTKDTNTVTLRRRNGPRSYKDPKYSKYYSKGELEVRDDVYSTPRSSSSSNYLNSETERPNMSILRAAEKFAGEL